MSWVAGVGFAIPLWLLALFCLYFFRDPDREIPSGPVAVSPADGSLLRGRSPLLGAHDWRPTPVASQSPVLPLVRPAALGEANVIHGAWP